MAKERLTLEHIPGKIDPADALTESPTPENLVSKRVVLWKSSWFLRLASFDMVITKFADESGLVSKSENTGHCPVFASKSEKVGRRGLVRCP